MKQRDEQLEVFDFLNELSPEVKTQLEKCESYQRFIFERARLRKIVNKSWNETGKLNSSEAMEQEKVVTTLGMDVLTEIEAIQFMLNEPSCEEFQELKQK